MPLAFDPILLGGRKLPNRIVMAPMTRNRADPASGVPTEAMALYYAQRAGAGLIITEGTQPSAIGQGYSATPGLHSAEQVAGWRKVTDAVHAAGGTIFAQLMHTGRISHPTLLPDGAMPVAPSAVAAAGQIFTFEGMKELVVPRELTASEIHRTIEDFTTAAENAIAAGFDGVEVHGANGYLIHQFLSTNANLRSDEWGGSVAGRIRFAAETVASVAAAIGAHRTGLRISPANPYNDIAETGHHGTYRALIDSVAPTGLAYLHIRESGPDDRALTRDLSERARAPVILSPFHPAGPTSPDAVKLIADGTADLVAFGTLFLANPDLPRRLALGGPFNTPDRATFYGGGQRGYTDYGELADDVS